LRQLQHALILNPSYIRSWVRRFFFSYQFYYFFFNFIIGYFLLGNRFAFRLLKSIESYLNHIKITPAQFDELGRYIYIYIFLILSSYFFTSRLGYFCLSKLGHVKANLTCFNFKPGLARNWVGMFFFSYQFLLSFVLRYFLLDHQIAFRSIKSIELR
jgi:hypothetical protein